MYEERKEKFSFKNFFLTLLLVLLFVFLMLWLFPTKWDVNKLNGSDGTFDMDRLSVLYDEIFANNVGRMKEAAIGYYTNERMPQTVGQSKKLTLQQMYDLHLVLKMKDKDGKACDTERSYVEITKYTEEYRLKVNLSCGNDEDFIIVYLGCYSYCPGGVCEKQVSKPSSKTYEEEKKYTPDTPKTPDKPKPPVEKKYMYEYKLVTEGCTNCTSWSNWQKQSVTATNEVKVETKEEKEIVGYDTVKVQTGTKKTTIVTGTKEEKVVIGYSSRLVQTGTKQIQIGTTQQTVTEKYVKGTVQTYSTSGSGTTVPANTSTTIYKVTGSTTQPTCSNCATKTIYTWDVYKVTKVYDVRTVTKTVPVYKTIKVYEEQSVPVYDYKTVNITKTVTTPVYVTKQVPKYANVKYYRYKTCKTTQGTTSIKWSYSKFDSDLIGKGYKLTGNVKEA